MACNLQRSQPEGITFLADKDNSSLYTVSGAIVIPLLPLQLGEEGGVDLCGPKYAVNMIPSSPGLDYVSHEEVLPYTSTDSDEPFRHELFEQFLVPSADESSEWNQI